MSEGNGNKREERPPATLAVVWDPNNGQLQINATEMSPMETLGVLFTTALEVYLNSKKPAAMPRIIPASPLMPHLKG